MLAAARLSDLRFELAAGSSCAMRSRPEAIASLLSELDRSGSWLSFAALKSNSRLELNMRAVCICGLTCFQAPEIRRVNDRIERGAWNRCDVVCLLPRS